MLLGIILVGILISLIRMVKTPLLSELAHSNSAQVHSSGDPPAEDQSEPLRDFVDQTDEAETGGHDRDLRQGRSAR